MRERIHFGMFGFHFVEGGQWIPQKMGGDGEKGTIDRHHYIVIMNVGAKGAKKIVSPKICRFFSPNIWQIMTFLNCLHALVQKITFSFSDSLVSVISDAQRSLSVGLHGSCQWSPFGGGSGRRAL